MRFLISSSSIVSFAAAGAIAVLGLAVAASGTGCNKLTGGGTAADGGVTTTSGPSLASKALSLLGVAGEKFEGDITMSMKAAAKPTPDVITFESKGDKLRFTEPGKTGQYVIFNAADKKMMMVDDAKKQAIVMDLGGMVEAAGSMGHPTPAKPEDDFSIDKSGSDVVAGYACDIWKITETPKNGGAVRKSEACLAKGIAFPDMTMGLGQKSWKAKLLTENYFPLRVVTQENGVEKERMEVTKIDKKTLDPARFEVPAGYKITDMSDMMKGLGNFGGGAGGPGMAPNLKPPMHH